MNSKTDLKFELPNNEVLTLDDVVNFRGVFNLRADIGLESKLENHDYKNSVLIIPAVLNGMGALKLIKETVEFSIAMKGSHLYDPYLSNPVVFNVAALRKEIIVRLVTNPHIDSILHELYYNDNRRTELARLNLIKFFYPFRVANALSADDYDFFHSLAILASCSQEIAQHTNKLYSKQYYR
tara:strand:- start:2185 stop:2730 length:546 start_codon:yes stop_codon:yes gene_type:complete